RFPASRSSACFSAGERGSSSKNALKRSYRFTGSTAYPTPVRGSTRRGASGSSPRSPPNPSKSSPPSSTSTACVRGSRPRAGVCGERSRAGRWSSFNSIMACSFLSPGPRQRERLRLDVRLDLQGVGELVHLVVQPDHRQHLAVRLGVQPELLRRRGVAVDA